MKDNINTLDEEKKVFQTYIKYAADNTYLDYEKIYNIFSNLVIERNVDFVQEYGSDHNTSSYTGLAVRKSNKIQLRSENSNDQALFHELCHMDNEDLPLWFDYFVKEYSNHILSVISGSIKKPAYGKIMTSQYKLNNMEEKLYNSLMKNLNEGVYELKENLAAYLYYL